MDVFFEAFNDFAVGYLTGAFVFGVLAYLMKRALDKW